MYHKVRLSKGFFVKSTNRQKNFEELDPPMFFREVKEGLGNNG